MKLRILRRRSRRNARGLLKLGRKTIQGLDENQFNELLERARSALKRPKSEIKRQRKLLLQLRHFQAREEGRISAERRSSQILDSLLPSRTRLWVPLSRRTKKTSILVSEFSFLDNPRRAVEILCAIAKAEATVRDLRLDFADDTCLDIGPYMVLALARDQMLPIITGGRITGGVREAIDTVGLGPALRIRPDARAHLGTILPFPVQHRRATGKSEADNLSTSVTTEERQGGMLAETIDRWLGALSPPRALNERGKAGIMTVVTEALDNAKRHGDPNGSDGSWSISGFLEAQLREDGTPVFVCHIGMLNLGATIAQSLRRAPESIRAEVESYVADHKSRLKREPFDEDALWTLCALQDGISRRPMSEAGARGGVGMMTLVEMMNGLNRSPLVEERPALTIISGTSCLMVRDQYHVFGGDGTPPRTLAFNPQNDLAQPPDGNYVFALPSSFPGTIVVMRFFLDPLASMTRGASS
jgi:hypothetical protein